EDCVGMAMPIWPLSWAKTAVEAVSAMAPTASTVASVLKIFTSRLPLYFEFRSVGWSSGERSRRHAMPFGYWAAWRRLSLYGRPKNRTDTRRSADRSHVA